MREIPLEAITGTVEPGRAREFDSEFRPSPRDPQALDARVGRRAHRARAAADRGRPDRRTYAIRDGHHRVSVARARGAATIDAIVA